MERIKVFICHSSEDRIQAGKIKESLVNNLGFDVFLAHEDIEPAAEWDKVISRELSNSDLIFILLSSHSKVAPYANQEIGMALALKKRLIPVQIESVTPYGFISIYQSCRCNPEDDESILRLVTTIFFQLIKNTDYIEHREKAINSLIFAFSSSGSFRTTKVIIRIFMELEKINMLSLTQLDALVANIGRNYQVYGEWYAYPSFNDHLKKRYSVVIRV